MKRIALLLVTSLFSINALSADAEFLGYLRGGTGLNLEGGKQECFNNQGIPGNFLRLGNECSFYSELIFAFHHKKPTDTDPMFFRTQVRLMFGAQGTRAWEPASNRDVNQVEAYVTAGGLSEVPGEFWIGKRFYRDVDLNIFDWYYYAEMSGVGAGWENVKVGPGFFSFAHLIQTNDSIDSLTDAPVQTDVGRPVLQAMDFRYKAVPVFAEQKLNFWGVYAWAPASNSATEQFIATNGYSVATRLEGKLGSGYNNFSVMYGKGTMKDFNIYANSTLPANDPSQNKAWNVRVVEDFHKDVTDRWAVLAAIAGEYGDSGADQNSKRHFYEVGARPIYYFTDRFQLMAEFGFSRINNEADGLGDRDLTRISLAPQISFSKSIWGRPVLRAFVAHSFWNDANKTQVANGAPTFADKTAGTNIGYQFETWF